MIFSTTELYNPSTVFQGRTLDPLDWSSRLPDLSVFSGGADPALLGDLYGGGQIAELTLRNVASALRLTLGRVAITQGFASTQFPVLNSLFGDPLEMLARGLDIAKEILGSKAFSKAIDQIGWIPIVGWIIEILASVVELVVNIVARVRDKNLEEARKELDQIAGLPIARWSAGADEALTRAMMLKLESYDAQWIASPRYAATSSSEFRSTPVEINPGDRYHAGWLVYTGALGGLDGSSGMGYIPGTRNLHGGMELRTRGSRDFRDLGQYFPTARIAAVQWWEMIVGGGPAMFSVDAGLARQAWADYVRSAIDFADNILNGWSASITATKMGAATHTCDTPLYGVGECKKSKRSQQVPIPGTGHRDVYLEYIFSLFDPKRLDEDRGWERDNIDYDDTIPGRALKNLEERQAAVLQSLSCMHVDDSEIDGSPRFRAIGTPTSKGPMWGRWFESVKAVFESGEWKRVRFDDVPEGALKQELRERCEHAGIKCADLGMQFETHFAAPSTLGNPVPPTPPDPVEVRPKRPKFGQRLVDRRKRKVPGSHNSIVSAGVLGGIWWAGR